MGTNGAERPVTRLLAALEKDRIEYMLIGMSAAVVQGVMGQTLDVDLWIDLPPRRYMRPVNLAVNDGAVMAANTVVYLEDGMPVNFVYEVDGLESFKTERKQAILLPFYSREVPVLSLERIYQSKKSIQRDKDLLHLKMIEEFLACRKFHENSEP